MTPALIRLCLDVLRALARVGLLLVVFTSVLNLTACSSTPGSHAQAQSSASKNGTHTVANGETLYSIAWTYGLDYKSLAKANRLDKNYTIFPGQVLHLDGTAPAQAAKISKPAAMVSSNSKKTPYAFPAKVTPASATPVTTGAAMTEVRESVSAVAWIWPAKGAVMQHYSESGAVNKGIDISGTAGDPVLAASSGKVVYAGSGLVGYGQLVIIKHNEQMLSAYAHNKQLLVKEGDEVKTGQKIAEIGATGTDKVKLHFEIRRDGKPVDPEQYLPRR